MPRRVEEAEGTWEKVFDVEVALRVIELISTGMYRSPGGVLKELVSNSFDSGAKHAWVTTDFPATRVVTVRDDGVGMTKKLVFDSFTTVGASQKSMRPELFESIGRPLVGRFGIGFLAAAHISKHIRMRTYPEDEKYGLEVDFDLSPYFDYVRQIEPMDKFVWGSVKYKEIDRTATDKGTVVELLEVDKNSPFYQALHESGRSCVEWPADGTDEERPEQAEKLARLLGSKPQVRSVDELAGHERVLWELGIICPVRYLDGGPVASEFLGGKAKQIVDELRASIEKLDFQVFFDGVEVRKPILLPTPKGSPTEWDRADEKSGEDVTVYALEVSKKLPSKERLSAKGYLVFQPHNVVPEEIRGLLVRVRSTGVGRYDNTLFRAFRGEKPLLRVQLSGELYVEKGLDRALTIDRHGFDEQDPGFIALRRALLNKFTESKTAVAKSVERVRAKRKGRRTKIKREVQRKKRRENVRKKVERTAKDHPLSFRETTKESRKSTAPRPVRADYVILSAYPTPANPQLTIDHRNNSIQVTDDPEYSPELVALIVAVDRLMGELPDPATWRRRLAEELRRIL